MGLGYVKCTEVREVVLYIYVCEHVCGHAQDTFPSLLKHDTQKHDNKRDRDAPQMKPRVSTKQQNNALNYWDENLGRK